RRRLKVGLLRVSSDGPKKQEEADNRSHRSALPLRSGVGNCSRELPRKRLIPILAELPPAQQQRQDPLTRAEEPGLALPVAHRRPARRARVHHRPARAHHASSIRIEDTGVGTALVSELKNIGLPAMAVKPQHSKQIRMFVQSQKLESGPAVLPKKAQWLD